MIPGRIEDPSKLNHEVILLVFLDSSMVEHAAVNRGVVGSSPTRGVVGAVVITTAPYNFWQLNASNNKCFTESVEFLLFDVFIYRKRIC